MNEKIVSDMLDELTKISAGLAPAGAPTVNSKGAGLAPKLPKLTGVPKPGGVASMMPKVGAAFFEELLQISGEVEKTAANPLHSPKGGALVGAAAAGLYSGARHLAKEKKEHAKDVQRGLSPEEQKKQKRTRTVGAAIDVGTTAATGAAAGGAVGKANDWAKKNLDPDKAGGALGDWATKVTNRAVDEMKKNKVHQRLRNEAAGIGTQAATRVRRDVGRKTGYDKLRVGLKMLKRKVTRAVR